ncbi:isochorismatase family cysteine hydrolase [Ectobacillus polymachus]|uniref:isochorismatase family cysteine hydrolase n=1 Tax=Ectobacillus polymachus TaxID=1508806 RepID=UPI003A87A14A
MRNTALLVMDMQRHYINAVTPIEYNDPPAWVHTINRAIEQANHHNIMVLYVVTPFEANLWNRNHMVATEGSVMLDYHVKIINDLVFTKKQHSAFSSKRLVIHLREYHISHVILVGLLAETSITSTAHQAKKKGMYVTVIADAIASASLEKKKNICHDFVKEGINVCTLHDIFI